MITLYNFFVTRLLVYLAAATLAFCTLTTVYDVGLRALGLRPPAWSSTLVEYAMLFLTMCIAPVLVRTRGHISIEMVIRALPRRAAQGLALLVYLISFAVCAVVAYYAARMGLEVLGRGEIDNRAIAVPRWVLFAFLFVGFATCAIEFLRLLARRAPPAHAGDEGL